MTYGLSASPGGAEQAEAVGTYEEPVLPPKPAARSKPAVRHTSTHVESHPLNPGEEPGDRATRVMDLEVQRLETAARRATNSICRGC